MIASAAVREFTPPPRSACFSAISSRSAGMGGSALGATVSVSSAIAESPFIDVPDIDPIDPRRDTGSAFLYVVVGHRSANSDDIVHVPHYGFAFVHPPQGPAQSFLFAT